jgi:hypothetical protein
MAIARRAPAHLSKQLFAGLRPPYQSVALAAALPGDHYT